VVHPHVDSISPQSGQVGSGVEYRIFGSNFISGALMNLSHPGQNNLTSIGTLSGSDLTGNIILPVDAAIGPWNVSVNQGGLFSNDNVLFMITAATVPKPVIHNLNPGGCLQNSYSSPFQVIITGTGFDTVSGTNNVTVDGSVVPYIVESPTRISATFPEIIDNTLGNHPVIVNGISGSSAPMNFVVSSNGFTIDASSDGIGWISPSGVFSADPGTTLTINFKQTAGARIKNLTVNGVEQSTVSPFVIPSVEKDYIVRLNNEPLPGVVIAAFTVESDDGYTVIFTDKSWGAANQWKWDFGDGSFGTGNPVSHSYSTPGSYSVSLWVRSDLSQSQVVIGDIIIPMSGEAGPLTFGP